MELVRFKDIVGFSKPSSSIDGQDYYAFNSHSMEVAVVSEDVWKALSNYESVKSSPGALELSQWQDQGRNEFQPKYQRTKVDSAETEDQSYTTSDRSDRSEQVDQAKISTEPRKNYIRSISINISQICNLSCTYCAAGGDGTYKDPVVKISVEKTIPQLLFLLGQVPPGDNFHVTFIGGEPLLYPDGLRGLASYAKEVSVERGFNVGFSIVTNGTLLSDNIINLLNEFEVSVTISLDGPPEINDRFRPQKNGEGITFKIVEGVNRLLKNRQGIPRILFHGVFSKANQNLVEAYRFYREFDVDGFEFTCDVSTSDSEFNKSYLEALSEIARLAYEFGGEKELERVRNLKYHFDAIDNKVKAKNFCGSGKSYLVIDARNKMYSCPWEVGNSKELVGQNTELNERAFGLAEDLINLNSCQNCWARHLCGGGCMFIHKAKTGNKHQKDPLFCERTRGISKLALEYYVKIRKEHMY